MSLKQTQESAGKLAAIKAAALRRMIPTYCVSCQQRVLIPIHHGRGFQPCDSPGIPHRCRAQESGPPDLLA